MRHQTRSILLALVLSVLSFHAAIGQETKYTAEELTDRAEVVAIGKVSAMRSDWNAERTRIFTEVTIMVDEYLKGEQEQTALTLKIPGGEIGEVGEVYSHVARFKSNEEVVVFARRDTRGEFTLVAGEQGKLAVTTHERTGRKMIEGDKLLDMLKSRVRLSVDRQLNNR